MKEALKPKTNGIKSASCTAKWFMAPLVAGILTIGCDSKFIPIKEHESSGPAVDCIARNECVRLLKKGEALWKVTDNESLNMELRITDIDSRGVTFESRIETLFERSSGKFRVNFDGSLEATGYMIETAGYMNLKVEKVLDPDSVRVIFPFDKSGTRSSSMPPPVREYLKEKRKDNLGSINIH